MVICSRIESYMLNWEEDSTGNKRFFLSKCVEQPRFPILQWNMDLWTPFWYSRGLIKDRHPREVPTLQSACRDAILKYTKRDVVNSLPLPKHLRDYLLYQSQ